MYCYSIEISEIQKKKRKQRSGNKYGSHFEHFWVCLQVFDNKNNNNALLALTSKRHIYMASDKLQQRYPLALSTP